MLVYQRVIPVFFCGSNTSKHHRLGNDMKAINPGMPRLMTGSTWDEGQIDICGAAELLEVRFHVLERRGFGWFWTGGPEVSWGYLKMLSQKFHPMVVMISKATSTLPFWGNPPLETSVFFSVSICIVVELTCYRNSQTPWRFSLDPFTLDKNCKCFEATGSPILN